MATVLEELLIQIGVDVDEQALKKFKGESENVKKVLNKVAAAAAAAAAAITAYTLKMAKGTDSQIKFARSAGIAFKSLQELEFAAQREGAAAGELTSTLASLNNQLGQLAIGRGPLEAIRRLGLSIRRSNGDLIKADELLLSVGERIKGLSPQRQAELVGQLGISQNILQLLQQSRKSIEQYRVEARKAGLENVAFGKNAEKLNDTLLTQRYILNLALQPLRVIAGKIIIDIVKGLTTFLKITGPLIAQLSRLLPLILTLFAVGSVIKWTTMVHLASKEVWGLVAALKAATIARGALSTVQGASAVGGAASVGGAVAGAGAGAGLLAAGVAALPVIGVIAAIAAVLYGLNRTLKDIKTNPRDTRAIGGRNSLSSGSYQDNRDIKINIYEATDARQVGKVVRRIMKDGARNGNVDFQTHVF